MKGEISKEEETVSRAGPSWAWVAVDEALSGYIGGLGPDEHSRTQVAKAVLAIMKTTDEPEQQHEARVTRGGSWFNAARNARAAVREDHYPDGRSRFIGFRVARRTPPPQIEQGPRLLRGGSWNDGARFARAAFRVNDDDPVNRFDVVGFRVARLTRNKSLSI